MATVSDRRASDGKIVRGRRGPVASRTPCAPPEKLPKPERAPIEEDHENPNWLSGLIYPAKMIASGAGKLLSFFDPGSPSFSSDAESSENDDEEDEVKNDVSFLQHGRSDKVLSSSRKTEKKRKIEQLVMQETFSREEGSELIKLIKSRLVDADENSDESAANMRTTAIMEARKWLQQKRFGSKEKVENELDATNLAIPYQATRNEKGSTVGMAKSYMQNRHPWASPTLNRSEFGSPSPLGVLHFKEETPRSTLYSFEMKTSSVSSGSWNILEEVRRVRSKATEELLAATPLTKTRMSPSSPEDATHDRLQNVLLDASTILPSRINQVGDAVQSMEPHECQQDADLKSNKDDKVNDLRRTAAENGFPSTVCSLAGGQDATLSARPSEEENGNTGGSSQAGPDVHMEDPQANPPSDVINGAQNSSSIELEELFQEPSQPIEEQTSKTIAKDSRRERKSRRECIRRGRGGGKQ